MRIGVNLLYLRVNGVGGSEVYVRHVLEHLARIEGNRLVLFGWDSAADSFRGNPEFEFVPVASRGFSQARRLLAENLELAKHLESHPVDVLFSPGNFAAPFLRHRVPQVATIHDLQHVHFPGYFRIHQRLVRAVLFRATSLRCRELIAISESTRRDFVSSYGAAGAPITVVSQGITTAPKPPAEERERVRRKYRLFEPFLYYPAMLAPHKNHEVLLDALGAARRRGARQVPLVLTGARTDGMQQLECALHARGLDSQVRHLGFVDRDDVLPLMASAVALVYPSLFEGFGLPLLEAMHCEVPVVASNATSIPEVVGNAALLVPPRDAAAWEQAIHTVLDDETVRRELVARGTRNVQRFSWERAANETQCILERCAASKPVWAKSSPAKRHV